MDADISWLDVESLVPGFGARSGGLDLAHVASLAEMNGRWPPILVHRQDTTVIDGHHRVAAARSIGQQTVAATFFDGTYDEAFCEAIRRNVEHGLPLPIEDRKRAARKLITSHPDWSDRHIGEVCGVAPGTVGRLRPTPSDPLAADARRVGRDGRVRLVQPQSNHNRILRAVRENPHSSLRAIAREVGTSPETVRRVRRRLAGEVEDSPPPSQRGFTDNITHLACRVSPERQPRSASLAPGADSAVTSTPEGKVFATWFDQTQPGDDGCSHVAAVPVSRIYEIADEARRRARIWTAFAEALEARVRPGSASSRST